ncbi:hypothetical protein [Nocardia sp. NPDC057353]|uniref:hypothetical protein n=1 Tax=Nocardia sp. NPDC057353 TaxID=3346104 RepID=UPI0036320A1A
MLQADIDQLRRLATTLDEVGREIDGIDVRTAGDRIAAALPGCSLGQVCAQAGEFSEGAWLRVAQRVQRLGDIVRQSADNIQITEEEFAQRLDTMDFRARV